MNDVIPSIEAWQAEGRGIALAFSIQTEGASPQQAGACMAVNDQGRFAGSVSGGCIEGTVLNCALHVIETRRPQLLSFQASRPNSWDVAIPCGGTVDVFVTPFDPEVHGKMIACLEHDRPFTYCAVVDEASPFFEAQALFSEPIADCGAAGQQPLPAAEQTLSFMDGFFADEAREEFSKYAAAHPSPRMSAHRAAVLDVVGVRTFFLHRDPRPTLVCVGAVHIAEALIKMAHMLKYRTVVVDPRAAFATPDRFPCADKVVNAWPQEVLPTLGITDTTAICALTHDEKIDVPALDEALKTEAFYIGCLGSSKTQRQRRRSLEALGWSNADFARIYGPIGLYIGGGRSPETIALSTISQVVALKSGRIAFGEQMPGHTMDSQGR